ncbi:hypothetical protein [Absidia glauca]|uniref:Cas12f1-like TNB domain-containing protein n=1 Tax=Absidia glauca TaxID=4829 RepID=A0A163IYA4_ABSGL|nr:hypothetical protein [Absidia glauca]SAM09785.1 hypothetical protein [Absidia glauca]
MNGQISEHQRQLDLLDGAALNLQLINVFDTTELLQTIRRQKASLEALQQTNVDEKESLQQKYLDQVGGSTMKRWKKNRHGSRDTTITAIPLVAFGAGMLHTNHSHIHGYPVGSTNVVRRHMLERQRRALCLVGHTDEYLTSQICASCGERMNNAEINNQQIYALKHCQRCNKIMNHDKNAASNMFSIMQSSIIGDGRPPALSRS